MDKRWRVSFLVLELGIRNGDALEIIEWIHNEYLFHNTLNAIAECYNRSFPHKYRCSAILKWGPGHRTHTVCWNEGLQSPNEWFVETERRSRSKSRYFNYGFTHLGIHGLDYGMSICSGKLRFFVSNIECDDDGSRIIDASEFFAELGRNFN